MARLGEFFAELEGAFGDLEAFGGDFFFELEFFAAEVGFGFLDGGVAFANGGVALAAEDEADAVECVEVGSVVARGEGEFEGGLFEDVDGGFGECVVGIARAGVELREELVGSGGGVGRFFE